MKYVFSGLIIFFGFFGSVSATAPQNSFTVAPSGAAVGSTVSLQALIYNAEKSTVVYTVVFANPTKAINTQTVSIPSLGAKTIKTDFVVPKENITITASIQKATTTKGARIATVEKAIGNLSIGPAPLSKTSLFLKSVEKTPIIGKVYVAMDAWRLVQLEYFTSVRDGAKLRVGSSLEDMTKGIITENIQPALTGTPAPIPEENKISSGGVLDYVTYIFSAMLVQLFANQTAFFIASGLVLLLILRTIFRRVF
jgi:hypothetical protein